jgi:histidyl-tRNA synthetase
MTNQKQKLNLKTGVPAGFSDLLPLEKTQYNKLMQLLSKVVETYDFAPIETPTIEWMDTLKGQDDTGGKLIYGVKNGYEDSLAQKSSLSTSFDKGLRFDLTVPLARFITDHYHELPKPFRRYHQGNVFRGETAQTGKGRYREFTQFDADIVGSNGVLADAEIASMLHDVMTALQLPAVIKLNNRLILDGLIEIGFGEENIANSDLKNDTDQKSQITSAIFRAIDKFTKVGEQEVLTEIHHLTQEFFPNFARLTANYLEKRNSSQEKIKQLKELLARSTTAIEGLNSISQLIALLESAGIEDRKDFIFAPEIVRGLDYYTGVLFETFIKNFEQFGSVASGGRYDNLIKDLGGPDLPAVGASFGVSRLLDVLVASGWKAGVNTPAQVFIARFESPDLTTQQELDQLYFKLACELRKNMIAVHLFSESKKVGHQLNFAGDMKIPFAILIGLDELNNKMATIKNLNNREQSQISFDKLVDYLKGKFSDQETD